MRLGAYAAALAAFMTSCAHDTLARRVFVGEVISVQSAAGDYLSPSKGPVPLSFVTVRISAAHGDKPVRMRIAVMEIYSAAVHGGAGDKVSFRYFDRLSFDGEVSFRDIDDYRVIAKKG